jgi:hypothetical protein
MISEIASWQCFQHRFWPEESSHPSALSRHSSGLIMHLAAPAFNVFQPPQKVGLMKWNTFDDYLVVPCTQLFPDFGLHRSVKTLWIVKLCWLHIQVMSDIRQLFRLSAPLFRGKNAQNIKLLYAPASGVIRFWHPVECR